MSAGFLDGKQEDGVFNGFKSPSAYNDISSFSIYKNASVDYVAVMLL